MRHVVPPDPGLRLEPRNMASRIAGIGLLGVDIGWHPAYAQDVQPPAIEVKGSRPGERSRKADDIEVVIFNPEPSRESQILRVFPRLHIDHRTAHLAQSLPTNETEPVVLTIEVIFVDEHRLNERNRHEEPVASFPSMLPAARPLRFEKRFSRRRATGQIQAA